MFLEQTWKLLETCNASLKKDCESSCINNDKAGWVADLMYFSNHVARDLQILLVFCLHPAWFISL